MPGLLKVALAWVVGWVGSAVAGFVLAFSGLAVAGKSGAARAGSVMMTVWGLILVACLASAVAVWVVTARALPSIGWRVVAMVVYLAGAAGVFLVWGFLLAVLFNR